MEVGIREALWGGGSFCLNSLTWVRGERDSETGESDVNPALEESERGQEMPSGDQRGQRGIYPDSSASAVPAGGTDVQSVRSSGQITTQGKSSKTLDWMKSFSRSL